MFSGAAVLSQSLRNAGLGVANLDVCDWRAFAEKRGAKGKHLKCHNGLDLCSAPGFALLSLHTHHVRIFMPHCFDGHGSCPELNLPGTHIRLEICAPFSDSSEASVEHNPSMPWEIHDFIWARRFIIRCRLERQHLPAFLFAAG